MGSQFTAEYLRLLDQGMYSEAYSCAKKEGEKVLNNWWGNACKVLKQYALFNMEYADTKFMRSSSQSFSSMQIQAPLSQQQPFSPPQVGSLPGSLSLRGITHSNSSANLLTSSTILPSPLKGGGSGGSGGGGGGFTTSHFVPHNDLRNGIIHYAKSKIPLLESFEIQMSTFISLSKKGPDQIEQPLTSTEEDERGGSQYPSPQAGPLTPVLPRLSTQKTQKQRPGSLLMAKRYQVNTLASGYRSSQLRERKFAEDSTEEELQEKKDEFRPQDFIAELSYIFFTQAQMIKAYRLIADKRTENDMMCTVALGIGYCVGFIEKNVKKIKTSKFVRSVIYEGKIMNHAIAAHLAISGFKVVPSLISIFTCKKLLGEWHERCCNETIITVHPPYTPRNTLSSSMGFSSYRSFDGKPKSFFRTTSIDDDTNDKTWGGNKLYTFLDNWVKFLSTKASYYFYYIPKIENTEEGERSGDDSSQKRISSSSRGSDRSLIAMDIVSSPNQDTPDAIIRKLFDDFVIEIPYVLSVGLLLDMKNGPCFDISGYKCEDLTSHASGTSLFERGRLELSEFRSWVPLYCTQSPPISTKKVRVSKFSFAKTKQLQEEAGKAKLLSEQDGPRNTMLCAIGDIASIVRESGDGALRQELISCTGKVYTLALVKISPIESVYLVSLFPRGMFSFRDKGKDMEVIKDFFTKVSGFFQMNDVVSIIESPTGRRNSQKSY